MKPVSNLSAGSATNVAFLVLPFVLGALGLAGVALPPVIGLQEVEGVRAAAESRARETEERSAALARLRDAAVDERVALGLARLEGLFPVDPSELELQAAVRLMAEARGIALESVAVSEPEDPDFQRFEDTVLMRTVELRGRGTPESLVGLIEGLRALGHPTAVLGFSVSRPVEGAREFGVTAELGLFHAIATPPPDEVGSDGRTDDFEGAPEEGFE